MLRFARRYATGVDAHKYSSTLRLPTTTFPSKPDTITYIPQCSTELYEWQERLPIEPDGSNLFVFHDGPPYANGDLHLGHSLNKVLKDTINRWQLMRYNKRVFYRAGWDCHGLPIEMKALEALKKRKVKASDMTAVQIRHHCEQLARATIEVQKAQFQQLGIMADFKTPYITLNPGYEADQLDIFALLYEKGLVSRQEKPVFWSCETHTALAEGELEYNEAHKSKTTYLVFPIKKVTPELQAVLEKHQIPQETLSALIWTSTPWTIAANQAICVNANFDYGIVRTLRGNLIVAKALIEQVAELSSDTSILDITIPGTALVAATYTNPIILSSEFPILHGEHVTDSTGTGLVHTAPGHGNDDYFVGLANSLPIHSPVNNYGQYTAALPAGFEPLLGLKVLKEGTAKMLEMLEEAKMVYHRNDGYVHSYPYDWRSKQPIIIRATPQWFINVDRIKDQAMRALEHVEFKPPHARKRLQAFVGNRAEWCISRQRSWGVPLPMVYHKSTGAPLLELEVVKYTIEQIKKLGTNEWFAEDSMKRWLPEHLHPEADDYFKGKDTMDVWFDSGSSWKVVETFLKENNILDPAKIYADIYLEGSDQHRGWFQSSLLTRIAAGSTLPPYKQIVTHGFTVDGKGAKMSKSLGNIITPETIIHGGHTKSHGHIKAIGVDGLRLMIANSDYTRDMVINLFGLKHAGESLRKYRFTLKFLLGNLNGFRVEDMVDVTQLLPLDRYVMSKLHTLQTTCALLYDEHDFSKVQQEMTRHMAQDLSATYFDIIKDTMYLEDPVSVQRRAIQTTLVHIYKTYVSLLSPIMPALTHECWQHSPVHVTQGARSPFMLNNWAQFAVPETYKDADIEHRFDSVVWKVRKEVNRLSELGRKKNDGVVQHSQKCDLHVMTATPELLDGTTAAYFGVAKVYVNQRAVTGEYSSELLLDGGKMEVSLVPSTMHSCPRCWNYTAEKEDHLCGRCEGVLRLSQ
ncbi:hypothetical protein BABINDRAFT_158921 [Babjeviella inositovora NRRL Y-12698]|uniref:isoleucine--tRNA ligase n=1 Tax=Babjeviella inositovora NRRL Y-12698 TaxID=984486 RepID=A0A1E3QX78_9ASCO|nr:uncharacterized protein BABINDRAFT_158921 [Babjeviella inositovora NRRL Y-12698]ODQ82298.1 hypothetical protein BABINDRAFT_158921 [Babjeviella inositovora NRRL Y-12698]